VGITEVVEIKFRGKSVKVKVVGHDYMFLQTRCCKYNVTLTTLTSEFIKLRARFCYSCARQSF